MTVEKLGSARDYFEKVVKPNYDDFMGSESTFQRALNMAASLYHMHEWIFATCRAAAESALNQQFQEPHDVWKAVEAAVPEAGYLRDLANASKHVVLDPNRKPSTSMSHIANTAIVEVGYGQGRYGVGRYSAPSVLFEEGGSQVSLDDCATKLFKFWENLTKQMFP